MGAPSHVASHSPTGQNPGTYACYVCKSLNKYITKSVSGTLFTKYLQWLLLNGFNLLQIFFFLDSFNVLLSVQELYDQEKIGQSHCTFLFLFFKRRQQKPQGRLFSFYRKQLPLTSFDTVPASSAFSFSSSSSLSTTSSGRILSPQV